MAVNATVTYTDFPWPAALPDPDLPEVRWFDGLADINAISALVDGRRRSSEELYDLITPTDVLIIYRTNVTKELLAAAGTGLRAVIRQGVGVDNLNVPLLREYNGIHAVNIPDYCVDEVATHTLALILAIERGIVFQHKLLASGTFDIYGGGVPRRLSRRRAGIIGFGRVGRAVCQRLKTIYREVLVFDPFVSRDLIEGYGAIQVPSLPELLKDSHTLTLHCPLTPDTRGMIGAAELAALPQGAVLVNAARGALVQPEALGEALDAGHLYGAGIDVFSPEDPTSSPQWRRVLASPRAVLTSHRAFLSVEAEQSSRKRVAEIAREVLLGRPPVGCLTHSVAGCDTPTGS